MKVKDFMKKDFRSSFPKPEVHLPPCQASMIELFAKIVNYFREKAPSQMFDRDLNASLRVVLKSNTHEKLGILLL